MSTEDGSTKKTTQNKFGLARREFLKRAAIVGTAAVGWPLLARATTETWEEGDLQCQVDTPTVKPAYPLDAPILDTFVRLSEALTGVSPLDQNLAYQYLERFATHPQLTSLLPQLIKAYRDIAPARSRPTEADVGVRIMQEPTLRGGAEQVIYLWYVSAFFLPRQDDPTKTVWVYGSPEQYERGLLWSVIRAHAPMTPGGPYGYWADAPIS
jgi:D-sorbitol dehydrogenase-like protein